MANQGPDFPTVSFGLPLCQDERGRYDKQERGQRCVNSGHGTELLGEHPPGVFKMARSRCRRCVELVNRCTKVIAARSDNTNPRMMGRSRMQLKVRRSSGEGVTSLS